MKRIPAIIFIAALLVLIANSLILSMRIYKAVKLAESSKALSVHPNKATKRMLIAGGSAGVGTGAKDQSQSLAGIISREFPFAQIRNVSEDGAGASDILRQIRSTGEERFDVVLVIAGENDVLFFTDPDVLKSSMAQALHLASEKAPSVILVGMGNIGLVPAFFPPINWIYTERAGKVRDMLVLISRETGTQYVDLFWDKGDGKVSGNLKRYYADDLLHLGEEGYAMQYEDIKKQTALAEVMNAG